MASRNQISLILTVPHAVCLGDDMRENLHTCDYIAARSAAKLKMIFARMSNVRVIGPLYGKVNRRTMDLNRIEARGSAFRSEIVRTIRDERRSGRNVVLLDIHSFDSRAPWSVEAVRNGKPEPDVVYMCSCVQSKPTKSVKRIPMGGSYVEMHAQPGASNSRLERLQRSLAESGHYNVDVARSSVNDIIQEAKMSGAMFSILIEFNESLMKDKRRYDALLENLCETISRLF
jgi:hypothetical protein